jgi:tetratricopeptide (TPR) repeat protein
MLAPFVLETLEAALTAYRKDLGIAIPAQARPLRVEVYARTSDFVAVSTLTAKEVSTSGTVALCKFNRMMIVSPRRLARGYRWRDTLAHELVHFLLSRHTRNQLPLWLHEGIAKYEERRWSGPNDGRLHPIQQSILAEGRARNVYVPFREMMPSLAKLDSGWKTSLAFAEVTLLVKQILDDGGPERLRAVIDAFARGEAEGFRALGVVDEEELWNNFVARLRSTELTAVPGYKFIPLSVSEDEVDAEPEPIDDGAARKFTRLGDLLREQGYWQSAISEYTKARSKLGYSPAPLSLRFAEALMVGGLYHEAEMELRNLIVRDPDRATAHALLGKIALFRGDAAEALRRYETAFAIAPFVEAVVTGLAEAADRANDSNKRRMYRDALEAWHELKRGT